MYIWREAGAAIDRHRSVYSPFSVWGEGVSIEGTSSISSYQLSKCRVAPLSSLWRLFHAEPESKSILLHLRPKQIFLHHRPTDRMVKGLVIFKCLHRQVPMHRRQFPIPESKYQQQPPTVTVQALVTYRGLTNFILPTLPSNSTVGPNTSSLFVFNPTARYLETTSTFLLVKKP